MYRSEKVTSLLYGASPGARMDAILLERLYQRCIHRILNIRIEYYRLLNILLYSERSVAHRDRKAPLRGKKNR